MCLNASLAGLVAITASCDVTDAEVPVIAEYMTAGSGMYKVAIIAKLSRYDHLKKAMNDLGVTGMTVTQVMGCGIQKGSGDVYRGVEIDATLLPKVKVEVIVSKIPVEAVIAAANGIFRTIAWTFSFCSRLGEI